MSESFALINTKSVKSSEKPNPMDVIVLKIGKKLIIGREVCCDLRVNSIEISRKHALIDSEDHNWFLTDLQSTNGLFINGKALIPFTPYSLKVGDKVSFGPTLQSNLIYKFVDNYSPNYLSAKPLVKPSKRKECEEKDSKLLSKRLRNDWQQLFDSELSCSICHELYVCAVNLNCAHTFCQSCIEQWKHSNESKRSDNSDDEDIAPLVRSDTHCCPVCRQPIISQNRSLALDNVIDYLVTKSSPQLLAQRRQLIEERKQTKDI